MRVLIHTNSYRKKPPVNSLWKNFSPIGQEGGAFRAAVKEKGRVAGTLPLVCDRPEDVFDLRVTDAPSPQPDQADEPGAQEQRGAGDRGHDGGGLVQDDPAAFL